MRGKSMAFTGAALSLLALSACGGRACVKQKVEGRLSPREAAHVETACAADASTLTLHFMPDPESERETCEYLIVATAPADFPTPRVNVNWRVNETTMSGASFAVTDRFFKDRLSAAYAKRDPFGAGLPCSETRIQFVETQCRASVDSGTPYQSCGPVTVSGEDFLAGFIAPDDNGEIE